MEFYSLYIANVFLFASSNKAIIYMLDKREAITYCAVYDITLAIDFIADTLVLTPFYNCHGAL